MSPLVAGWLAIGIPLLVFGFFFLHRHRPVMFMFFGACLLGMGYLTATGAASDIGAKLLGLRGPDARPSAPQLKPAPADVPARNPADGY